MYYNQTESAYNDLLNNLNPDEIGYDKFNEAINRIISNKNYSQRIIEFYSDKVHEKVIIAIKENFLNYDPFYRALMITKDRFVKMFTDDEIETIVNLCCNNAKAACHLLKEYDKLTPELRLKAINVAMFDIVDLLGLFKSNVLTESEELFIVNKIIDNDNYVDSIFDCISDSYPYYSKSKNSLAVEYAGYSDNANFIDHKYIHNGIRKILFSKIIKDFNKAMESVNLGRLTKNEMLIFHDLYEDIMFSKLSRKTKDYFDYCLLFSDCLSYREQKLLVKKLRNKRYNKIAERVNSEVKLIDKFKNELKSILLANKMFNTKADQRHVSF